jgi:hypothetical protein
MTTRRDALSLKAGRGIRSSLFQPGHDDETF